MSGIASHAKGLSAALAQANSFLKKFQLLPAEKQKQMELSFFLRCIDAGRANGLMEEPYDYHKLELMRIWTHRPPITYQPEECHFLQLNAHGELISVEGPHVGGRSGPWLPTAEFESRTAAVGLAAVRAGKYCIDRASHSRQPHPGADN